MSAIGILGALATLFAAGFGALTLIVGERNRLHVAEQFALSWLYGTGIVSLSIWLLGWFIHGVMLFSAVALVCVALPILAWRRNPWHWLPANVCEPSAGCRCQSKLRCGDGYIRFRTWRPSRSELVLAGILALEILTTAYLSFGYTLGWDGLLNWEIKARYAFANGGVLPPAYFQDGGRAFSHPEYPLAIPFTELWLYFWLGDASQFWAKTIFPIFYASGAALLVAISARLTGKSWCALIGGAVLFFIPQITVEAGSAIVGYADFPLSIFYLAAIGYLLCFERTNDDDLFRLSAVAGALLPWVKREGVILWMITVACTGFIAWRHSWHRHSADGPSGTGISSPGRRCHFFLAVIPGLCTTLAWRLYLGQMHAVSAPDFVTVNFRNLISNLHRLGPICSTFGSEFIDTRAWGVFWPVTAFAYCYFVRRYRTSSTIILTVAIIGPLATYAFIYIFSNWPDYHRHVGLSISRLLMHVTPLACLTLPPALASLPSWREAFQRSKISPSVAAATCGEQFPERTRGIDFA